MPILLRNVLENDTETAYQIFKPMHEGLCYLETDSSSEKPRSPKIKSYEEFCEKLEATNIFFVVLEETREIIGYIEFDVFQSGVAQINEIFIIPEQRRHGYGRSAVKELVEGLREDKEIKKIVVISATIATDNFYTSCRFRFTSGDMYELELK